MATLQKIRDRGVLIAIIIGIALFAFIIGDFLTKGSGGRSDINIAEIAGKSVAYPEFQQKVDYYTDINLLYSGKSTVDEETQERILDQSWEFILRTHVLEKEYNKLGVGVNSDEVWDMVQGRNIHQFIRQLFSDPNTGQFNQAFVIQFLKNMDRDPQQQAYWFFLENEIINERKFSKYNNLISKGLYVPTPYAETTKDEINKSVSFDYIVKRFSSIPDSSVVISESDIKDYYHKNKNKFKQDASRDIEYVIFDVVPSENDDRLAREWINRIYDEFKDVEDNIDFVNYNSDSQFDDKNYKNGELSDVINDFIFDAKIGNMFGPYFENGAYKIAKLIEINYLPDSVRAKHILIDAGNTQESDLQAKNTADSLKGLLLKGAGFDRLALEYSTDPGSKEKGGDLDWLKEEMMPKSFMDSCFASKIGDIKIIRSQFGYHVMQLLEQGKKVKKVKVAIIERKVEPSTETYQDYYAKASKFAGECNTYDKFIETIEKEGLVKRSAPNLKEADKEIPGLETSRDIIQWAYNSKINEINLFEKPTSYIVAILTNSSKEGHKDIEEVREMIQAEVKKEKKAEKIVEGLKLNETTSLESLAKEFSSEIRQAANIRFSSRSIPNAGFEPKLIAAAIAMDKDIVSKPIIGNNGVYVIKVTSIEIQDQGIETNMQKMNLMYQYNQRVNTYNEPYETLKDLADIKDFRSKFY